MGPIFKLELILEQPRRPDYAPNPWTYEFKATGEQDLLSHARDAAVWVRQIAGEPQSDIDSQNRSAGEMTTQSWDALRLANEAAQRRKAGQLEAAETLLREALEIDPLFPSANRDLADLLMSERRYEEGYRVWKAAVEASRTRQLNSRERFKIEAYYADDVGDLMQAEKANQAWIANYPADYLPHFLLGNIYLRQNRMAQASSHMLRARQLRPNDETVEVNLAYHRLIQGEFDQARQAIEALRSIGEPQVVDETEGKANFIWGLPKESQRCFERMLTSERLLLHRGALLHAACLAEQGGYDEAARRLRKLLVRDEQNGDWQWRAQKLLYLAELSRLQSRTGEAIEYARLALSLDNGDFVQEQAGVLLARCGDRRASEGALAALRALPVLPRTVRRVNRLAGEMALARHDRDHDLVLLRKAAELTSMWDLNDSLARGLELAGFTEQALAERIRLAKAKGFMWTLAERLLPGAWTSNVSALLVLAGRMGRNAESTYWTRELKAVRS